MSVRYISQKIAQQIDEELMSASGAFSLDQVKRNWLIRDPLTVQLMELAGLSCAQAVAKTYPLKSHRRVLVCCGPGNQGGDGLVAARHLHHFRYNPTIYLPKPGSKDIYQRLLRQCENLRIPVLRDLEELETGVKDTDVILDAIFGKSHATWPSGTGADRLGFSFHPPLRRPFDRILTLIRSSSAPILSVDIPSGWDVERGQQKLETEPDENGKVDTVETFVPDALISLTVPKEGVRAFAGKHWLGGRFVPDEFAKKFELNLPEYEGVDQVVQLPSKL